jgi:hypothetical protein
MWGKVVGWLRKVIRLHLKWWVSGWLIVAGSSCVTLSIWWVRQGIPIDDTQVVLNGVLGGISLVVGVVLNYPFYSRN